MTAPSPREVDVHTLTAFASHLRHLGRSDRTVDQYVRLAKRFLAFGTGDVAGGISVDDLTRWYVSETRGRSRSTQVQYAAAVRAYAAFARLGEPDLPKVRTTRADTRNPDEFRDALSEEEYTIFKHSVFAADMPPHAKTILLLLGETGLRVSEACGLHWRDQWQDAKYWGFIVTRKGGRRHRLVFSPEAQRILKLYLRTRRAPRHGHLFPGQGGEPYTPAAVRVHMRSLRESCGWTGRLGHVSPHVLRHTFASRMLRRGVPLRIIQSILDHRDLRTTTRYAKPDEDTVSQALAKIQGETT